MAYMIPPVVSEDVSSSGERKIFEKLKDDPETQDWTCLHSLGISRHVSTVYGEIDFLLLIPKMGIFCLEVKSGRVARKDGVWEYRNKYGAVAENTVGPIRQVSNAMHSLRKSLKEYFGKKHTISNLLYGWGVIFPQCEFRKSGPDFEPWQIYNLQDNDRPINVFLSNLAKQTHEKMKNQPWYDADKSRPSKKTINSLVQYLRGDFEFSIKKGSLARELQDEVLRFTSEQTRCLESLRGNRRCFFTGAAGTGKTVLAVEFAKRQARNGDKVLFLCFNRLLASKLNIELAEFGELVKVDHFHHYLDELVLRSSFREEFEAEKAKSFELKSEEATNKLFKETFPFYAELALAECGEKPFDALVVDEAQDLIIPKYLDVMDGLFNGGLSSGRWAFFGDLQGQKIFSDLTPDEMIAQIETRAPHHTPYSLMVNCRNTRNIGKDTCTLVGFDEPPFLTSTVTGPPVDYRYFGNGSEIPAILGQVVRELASEGIQKESIAILSRHTFRNSFPDTPMNGFRFKLFDITSKDFDGIAKDHVRFSTISSFKGLESPVVIIVGMRELDSEKSRDLLYVAMSRAIIRLFIILPENLEKTVKGLLKS